MQIHLVSFFSKILLNVALKFSRIAASKLFEMLDKSNIPTGSGSHGMLGGPPSQLKILLLAGLLSLLGFSFAANFQISAVSLGVGFYAVATVLMIWLFGRGYPHPTIGKGNAVTLGRLVLVSFLAANLLAVENPWLVVVIAISALVLDGVDGFLARKEGRVSDFGARIDMEVDSALALVLALNIWIAGITGPVILLLGAPRYLFIFAARFVSFLNKPLPYSLARRVISVVQIASLIGLNSPIIPSFLAPPIALIVAGLLIWSFGRDIIWLWRSRGS